MLEICEFVTIIWMVLLLLCFVGCCFLICPSREEADKAVNACHDKKTLPGVGTFVFCELLCFVNLLMCLILEVTV